MNAWLLCPCGQSLNGCRIGGGCNGGNQKERRTHCTFPVLLYMLHGTRKEQLLTPCLQRQEQPRSCTFLLQVTKDIAAQESAIDSMAPSLLEVESLCWEGTTCYALSRCNRDVTKEQLPYSLFRKGRHIEI